MVWRNGTRETFGTSLMIDRALTCRNSIPRNSPRPTCRSTRSSAANNASGVASSGSSANRQRSSGVRAVATFLTIVEHLFDYQERNEVLSFADLSQDHGRRLAVPGRRESDHRTGSGSRATEQG